ncbi:hypothetical protein QUB80_11995 [Chlorogloeopsis sp. ULAP01]|uniref:hypothetical protein n=1 Tax=Chlorogloeopsis sp. ULAP01 TaxID=3056483 RepID=UPI0025AA3F12|nr:hypothetical protein [Chlorogloeopsis sp. ULAP01]MDM9381423.1 hypothetical protein [Chlorogloeopsis sp. ULAP01]
MLYHLTLTSSLILASTLAVDRSVLAQSVDVPFSGTVPVQATFSTPIPGSTEPTIPTNSSGAPTKLESHTPATISVQTSTPATIIVSPPRFVSGTTPDPVGTTYVGFLKFGSTSVSSNVGGGSTTLPEGSTNLEVAMLVERPDGFTPGTYTYVVTLTVTP